MTEAVKKAQNFSRKERKAYDAWGTTSTVQHSLNYFAKADASDERRKQLLSKSKKKLIKQLKMMRFCRCKQTLDTSTAKEAVNQAIQTFRHELQFSTAAYDLKNVGISLKHQFKLHLDIPHH